MLLPAASSTSAAAMASRRMRVGSRSISVVASLGIRSSPRYPQKNPPTSLLCRRHNPLVLPSSLSPFSMTPLAVFMSTAISDGASKPMIHSTIESIRSFRKTINNSTSVGFVPTMGALHEGALHMMCISTPHHAIFLGLHITLLFGGVVNMDQYFFWHFLNSINFPTIMISLSIRRPSVIGQRSTGQQRCCDCLHLCQSDSIWQRGRSG